MTEHNEKLAGEIKAAAEAGEGAGRLFEGYGELYYEGETYPVDDAGIDALEALMGDALYEYDVLSGGHDAEPSDIREALEAQGYKFGAGVDLTTPRKVVRWRGGRTEALAVPTPFGGGRAREIYAAGGRGMGGDYERAMTDGEVAYVRAVWDTMPGNTCFNDAFLRIMHGRVGE